MLASQEHQFLDIFCGCNVADSILGGIPCEVEPNYEVFLVKRESLSCMAYAATKDQAMLPSGQDEAGRSHRSPLQELGSQTHGLPGPSLPPPSSR